MSKQKNRNARVTTAVVTDASATAAAPVNPAEGPSEQTPVAPPADPDAAVPGTEPGEPPAPPAPETVTVTSDTGVYVRSTPQKLKDRSNVVRVAKCGEVLPVVERMDEWVKIGEDEFVFVECVK
jgi:hypothetical protein